VGSTVITWPQALGLLVLSKIFFGGFRGGGPRNQWKGKMKERWMNMKPEETKMLTDLGIGRPLLVIISLLSLAVGVMVLLPQTFFAGNLLNAAMILLIMSLALKAGNIKTALIEIPFLIMPLVLIYLGHPFKK